MRRSSRNAISSSVRAAAVLESLEGPTFLSISHVIPHKAVQPTQVPNAYHDNRGGAVFKFTNALDVNKLRARRA